MTHQNKTNETNEVIELDEATKEFKETVNQWVKEAEKQTLETLPKFLRHLTEDYKHDYGTICHAMAIGAKAAAHAINDSPQGGISGFQAGAIMFEFIRRWYFIDLKSGLEIINYDDMLYPQYEKRFTEKTLTRSTFECLKEEAQRLLLENPDVHFQLKQHWEEIAKGNPPFGYEIKG